MALGIPPDAESDIEATSSGGTAVAVGPDAAAIAGAHRSEGPSSAADDGTSPTTGTEDCPGRGRGPKRSKVPVLILVGAFAVSRVIAAVAGVRFDDSRLDGTTGTDMWQLLDIHLLKDHLVQSVWNLNSQPPLFNLYWGLVVKLPHGWQRPFEVLCALGLGLVIVLCTYQVLVELGVPQWVALAVTLIGVVASPSYLLFENWLDYAYPTAALGVFAAWCLIRYLRTRWWPFGLGFFGAYGAIVLLNSTYQIAWLAVPIVVVVIVLRHHWRQVLAVAVVPVLLVGFWYAKNALLFGTTTTSSWLGMNLSRFVLYKAPPTTVAELERRGTLTPLASVAAFGAPDAYIPKFVRPKPNSVAVLGTLYKQDGATNFNNPIYITISSRYLHDDIAYIEARPGEYLSDISSSVQVWLVSSDQNFINSPNWPHVQAYAKVYDQLVEWQPVRDPAPAEVTFVHTPSPLSWISLQTVLVYLLALIGAPVVFWRRRRSDPALAGTVAVLWWTTLYAFAASSLIEIGENERYRFELGPIPLIVATVVVTTGVRALWSRRHRSARQSPSADTGV